MKNIFFTKPFSCFTHSSDIRLNPPQHYVFIFFCEAKSFSVMAALQYLESLKSSHPELNEWYDSLSDLYQKKLWHQLTLKLEQFIALSVFQVLFLFRFVVFPIDFSVHRSSDQLGFIRFRVFRFCN